MSEIRDHFVYTALDVRGVILYVGCTKDLDGRMKAHRSQSDWYPFARRFHVRGPYTYEGGRQVERERLAIDRPLYGFHPARRTLVAIQNRVLNNEHARLIALGMDFYDSIGPAVEFARDLIGYPGNRGPCAITDQTLRIAFAKERRYMEQAATGVA